MNFEQLPILFDVSQVKAELAAADVWNKNPCRLSKRGPHHETQDIILRYKDETENQLSGHWKNFSDPHLPDWYKVSDSLPSAKAIAFDLMTYVKGEMLGGVFLYKLEPGKQIYPHVDKGWHPDYFDKFNVCIEGNLNAAFCYDDDKMIQQPGHVHHFRNDTKHWVLNEGDTDCTILCVCIRLDRGYRVPFSPEGWSMDKPKEN
jgi:uncharacterized cupin superfamily protein